MVRSCDVASVRTVARRAMRCRKLWDAAALSRGRAPMAPDRSYIAENDRERRRLEALVGKLDDAALSRPMPDGWTVASVLAHLAFWDQRIVTFIELLKRGAKVPAEDPIDVEWLNAAAKPT